MLSQKVIGLNYTSLASPIRIQCLDIAPAIYLPFEIYPWCGLPRYEPKPFKLFSFQEHRSIDY